MNIYDTIQADQIEDGDQIIVDGDPLERVRVHDSEEGIWVVGESVNTGDRETYFLTPDADVDLWAV
jgi:hypothetical protein